MSLSVAIYLALVGRLHDVASSARRIGSAAAHRRGSTGLGGRSRSAGGQATAEYALVLLGAAAIALLLAAWAARSGKIGELFDVIVGQLIDRAQ